MQNLRNFVSWGTISSLLCTLSLAQPQINVDISGFGGCVGLPANDYVGAADQPGTWNGVTPNTSASLLDVNGNATGVFLSLVGNPNSTGCTNGCTGNSSIPCAAPEAPLLGDFHELKCSSGLQVWCFSGLLEGEYDIFTYGYRPTVGGGHTTVSVAGIPGSNVILGGPWPGGMQQGLTHSVHRVQIAAGQNLDMEVQPTSCGTISTTGAINGFQIVPQTIGSSFCLSLANSTGAPAEMTASGSNSFSANDLVLIADNVPGGQPGQFFYGAMMTQSPLANGFRCVAEPNYRLPISIANSATNQLRHTLDNLNPPSVGGTITAGSTWHFQAFFRDPAAGGALQNLSDGYTVTFTP